MPQRRSAAAKVEEETTIVEPWRSEVQALSLEDEEGVEETVPLEDSDDRHAKRVRHWKESAFAVGCVEPTWMAERTRDGAAAKHLPPDESGCLCCSALVCPLLGAGRVGNMIVLKSSTEWVEEVEEDEESGEQTVRRFSRPKLDLVLGPYWPMLCCVTYPLIFAVSGWTFVSSILPGRQPIVLVFVWTVFTSGLIVSLACTACRDPGILYRHRNAPPQHAGTWRWSDRADSFRPRDAWYDTDTAVVVEGFDHTCPWTGTAIGKRNFFAFQMFVCLVFLCMIMDIFLLTGAFA